jgi:hypothetical protein
MRPISAFPVILSAVLLAGCTSSGDTSAPDAAAPSSQPPGSAPASPIQDQATFIEALRTRGVSPEAKEAVRQSFLHAAGTRLTLRGGGLSGPADVQSYDYPDVRPATQDAEAIDPDGNSTQTMQIDWVAPPHFFRTGRLIVLYVGADRAVVRLLGELLGPQFAGG